MAIQKNYVNARLVFENAKSTLVQMGYTVNEALLTQSYLRVDVPLVASQTQYNVPILVNQPTPQNYPTNKLLNLQDTFVVSEFGFLVGVSSGSDFIPQTNESVFAANAAAARTLWNGQFSVTMDNQQIVPAYDLQRHYRQPVQQSATNADYTTSNINYLPSADLNSDGFESISPMWVLSGAKNIQMQVNLPAALSAVTANSRLVFMFRGILMQNTTSVR